MEIRQLVLDDIDAVVTHRRRAVVQTPQSFRATVEEEQAQGMELFGERLRWAPEKGALFGAFYQGAMAGMVGVSREDRAKLLHKALIWGMHVDSEHRSQGIGGRLLDAALDHAQRHLNVTVATLSHDATNVAARTLYESRGFVRWGTEPMVMLIGGQYVDEDHMILRF